MHIVSHIQTFKMGGCFFKQYIEEEEEEDNIQKMTQNHRQIYDHNNQRNSVNMGNKHHHHNHQNRRTRNWNQQNNQHVAMNRCEPRISMIDCSPLSVKYNMVNSQFINSSLNQFQITRICEIMSPHNIKVISTNTRVLYHGIKQKYLEKIFKYFDVQTFWRDSIVYHISAFAASFYGDGNLDNRCMLAIEVPENFYQRLNRNNRLRFFYSDIENYKRENIMIFPKYVIYYRVESD